MLEHEYFLGLDLGQKKNPSAIAIVERTVDRLQRRNPVTWVLEWEELAPPSVLVRHLERIPLGSSYLDVVDRAKRLVWSDTLRGRTQLIVDATGTGAPVVDLFRRDQDLKRACQLAAVTITNGTPGTGGPTSARTKGDWSVPRPDLVTGLALMIENQRLEIPSDLSESSRLVEELVHFDLDRNFGDDLVLALALACWKLDYDYPPPVLDSNGEPAGEWTTSIRKGPLSARNQQRAAEFVGMIMGVPAKRFRE